MAPRPIASAPSSGDACLAIADSLSTVVPPGESQAELHARGIRVRTPLVFAPGAAPRPQAPSGAAVQIKIAPDGTVVPGSPKTLKSVGETQVPAAVEAAALSMAFDIDTAAKSLAPISYTAVYSFCPRP